MHKFIKFSFNATINYFKAMQFGLILLALLTMIDFILFLLSVKLPPFIQVVFDFIYNVQSLIYKPDLSIIPVDFTLAVAAIEMLIIAGLIVYILNFIIEFEQIYDRVHKDGERRFETKFNKNLAKNAQKIENRTNNFVMLYDVEIEKVNDGYSLDDKTVDVDAKIVEYRLMFKNLMVRDFQVKYQQTQRGNLLFFNKFEDCNNVFEKIYEFTIQAKNILKENKLRFRLKTAFCIADEKSDKTNYLPKLNKLLNIAVPNKMMALGDFTSKYQSLKLHPYAVTAMGVYNLNDETIDVYTISR